MTFIGGLSMSVPACGDVEGGGVSGALWLLLPHAARAATAMTRLSVDTNVFMHSYHQRRGRAAIGESLIPGLGGTSGATMTGASAALRHFFAGSAHLPPHRSTNHREAQDMQP